MKLKHIAQTITLFFILLLCINCAGTRSGSTEQTKTDVPEWWFNPPTSETHYYAFGQAKKQNPSLAQKAATERARAEISDQIKKNISSEIRDWMRESGLGETAEALEFTENTIVSVSNNALEGASADKYARMDDGTVYVRVSYPKDRVSKQLVDTAKREEALYNEFKASQAFDRLEKKTSN